MREMGERAWNELLITVRESAEVKYSGLIDQDLSESLGNDSKG